MRARLSDDALQLARTELERGIAEGLFPGASAAIGTREGFEVACAGRHTYADGSAPITLETRWDLASVSKVLGTTTAAMLAVDDRLLELDASVADVLPDTEHKNLVTIRNLLLHDSGLPAYAGLTDCADPDAARERVRKLPLRAEPGAETVYSCMGFITLQMVLEQLFGRGIDQVLQERVWGPLGIDSLGYVPDISVKARCAPTSRLDDARRDLEDQVGMQRVNQEYIQGNVHDPAACAMGGVSGNAGLFGTAEAVGKVLAMVLGEGASGGTQVVCSATIWDFCHRQGPASTRGLGWDTRSDSGSSAGTLFGPQSFGHTGYTGTSVWVDPEAGCFVALLTNRVHPDDSASVATFRPQFHDAIWQSLCAR